jgi:DUF4097 and DUF4098 domain-containing protein YvlB
MRKSVKRVLIAVLTGVELTICAAIVLSLAVLQPTLLAVRIFYSGVVRAEETIEERVPMAVPATGGPLELRLTNLRGDVRVAPGQDGEIVIRAVKEVWGQDQQDAQAKLEKLQVLTEAGDGALTVRVEEMPEIYLFSLARSSRVTFEVTVPWNTTASLHTRDGDIRVRGIDGGVELTNRFGAVHVEDVVGDVMVDARDGDVTVRRSGAPDARVDLLTRYASLAVQQAAAGEMLVENRDGAVSLEDVSVKGTLTVNARYGGVELARVQAAALRVEADDDRLDLTDVRSTGKLDLSSKFGEVSGRRIAAVTLDVDMQDGSLTLEDVDVEREGAVTSRYVSIDLRNVRARAFTVRGHDRDVDLENVQLEGKLDVSAPYGVVRVTGTTAGEYRIETRDGPIVLDGVSGPLWLRNHYGDITVTGAQDATLDVEVQDGTLSFEGSVDDEAAHRIDGKGGDVNLRLPASTAASLDASTRFGRIECEFPVAAERQVDESDRSDADADRLAGAINGGGVKLRIKVQDGDITIVQAL